MSTLKIEVQDYIINLNDDWVWGKCTKCTKDFKRIRDSYRAICKNCKTRMFNYKKNEWWWKLERDKFIRKYKKCQICGNKEKLKLHHKNSNPEDNRLTNLILICATCHGNIHNKSRIRTKIKEKIVYINHFKNNKLKNCEKSFYKKSTKKTKEIINIYKTESCPNLVLKNTNMRIKKYN